MRFIFEFILEIFLLPTYVICGVLGLFIKLKPAPGGKEIVFVHGWLTHNPLYIFFKKYLESEGFSVYMTDIGLMTTDFNKEAEKLKTYIDRNDLKNFVLVGVSGGALVSYLYLQKLGGWRKTNRFISIGGPFSGTPLAFLGFPWNSGRQMIPGNNFLKQLRSELPINSGKIICVSAKYDELVPSDSSKLHGVNTEIIPVLGHVNLQAVSKETFKLVKRCAK